MSDQCKHCSCRGDIPLCNATDCNQHESWYAQSITKQLAIAVEALELLNIQSPHGCSCDVIAEEALAKIKEVE